MVEYFLKLKLYKNFAHCFRIICLQMDVYLCGSDDRYAVNICFKKITAERSEAKLMESFDFPFEIYTLRRSHCFSAAFTQLCPNGVGFVMDRHGVTGEIQYISEGSFYCFCPKQNNSIRFPAKAFSNTGSQVFWVLLPVSFFVQFLTLHCLFFSLLQTWMNVSISQIFAKMENASTMMEAIGANAKWDISLMKLERSVSVSNSVIP